MTSGDLSYFTTGVSESNKKISEFWDAFSGFRQTSNKLYEDVQKFNEQAKALKKARRAEKLEKIKNVFSTIGKGLLKTGKFLSLCAYSLAKVVGKGVETIGKGIVKGGKKLKRASSRRLEKLRYKKVQAENQNQQEIGLSL